MSQAVTIRALLPADAAAWQHLRTQLWPAYTPQLHAREMATILADSDNQAVFVADAGSRLVGFVEASLHPHAIGCEHAPVGYVEGWYVAPELRRTGIGRRLLAAAEAWALARGCREMASDAHPHNGVSQAAHRAAGYAAVDMLVHFRKPLTS